MLVMDGKLPLKDLFTIRQGEPAYDNVADSISPAETDIIKLKTTATNTTACIYFHQTDNACTIYAHRPLECRALACEQPATLTSLYRINRLTREALLGNVNGLWELVSEHQARCNYAQIAQLAKDVCEHSDNAEAAAKAVDELMTLVRYDHHLREGVLERSGVDPGMLDFLFGRPLSRTIRLFQLKLVTARRALPPLSPLCDELVKNNEGNG